MNRIVSRILSIGIFLLIGVTIFFQVQNVLGRDWAYPTMPEAPGDMMREFYQLSDTVDMQAVFFGASGFEYDIDPMRIYEDTHIVTYNLSSSGQPLPAGYYLCQDVLKRQKPKLVVFDATRVFSGSYDFFNGGYHYILDHQPLSLVKIKHALYYAKEYVKSTNKEKKIDAFIGAILPFYQYHDRWTTLTKDDFIKKKEGNLYRKGYMPFSEVTVSGIDEEWMNNIAEQIIRNDGWQAQIVEGEAVVTQDSTPVYNPLINEEAWAMILDMKRMCEENGGKFLLMKTPHIDHPLGSETAVWTRIKSDMLKKRAEQDGVDYLDLQYDVDLGIDWSTDAGAGTQHLNILGSRKVSVYLEDLLRNKYGIEGETCEAYEHDIPIYDKLNKLLELQSETELGEYLKKAAAFGNTTVFFSAFDDMANGLTDEVSQALNAFGLQTDFSKLNYSDAYAAVVENGVVSYEAYSNRAITHNGLLKNGMRYSLTSKGFLISAQSNIIINGVERSRAARGLNVVILDNESGVVLDTVSFDMHLPDRATKAIRTGNNRKGASFEYEEYLKKLDI